MGSGGGGGSGNPALLMQNANPMQGLPIAGQGGGVGNPLEYGKFQSFLPDIPAEGRAPSATGLRPDMFEYKSPTGVLPPGEANKSTGGSGKGSFFDNLNPQQQGYYDQHMARYGYPPEPTNPVLQSLAGSGGGGTASDDRNTLAQAMVGGGPSGGAAFQQLVNGNAGG